MKKMSGLLLVLLLGAAAAQAQRHEPVNPLEDKRDFQGYTIRVLPAPGGTYGYDIFKDRQLLLHQRGNPFTGSPRGLTSKEDVYKVAKWQIQNIKERRAVAPRPPQQLRGWEKLSPAQQARLKKAPAPQQRPFISGRVPLPVARELNIRLHQ